MAKKVNIKINELIAQRGISLRELSLLTSICHATLSELSNQKRQNINFNHIEIITEALNIDDIRELIDLKNTSDE